MANPSPQNLKRMGEFLAAPQSRNSRLWKDVALRLSDVANSYPAEYSAMLEIVSDHSTHPGQLHSAYQMARVVLEPTKRLTKITEKLSQSVKTTSNKAG